MVHPLRRQIDALAEENELDMNLDNVTTGTDVVRAALYARNQKLHPANLARDLGVSAAALDVFSNGKGNLTPRS